MLIRLNNQRNKPLNRLLQKQLLQPKQKNKTLNKKQFKKHRQLSQKKLFSKKLQLRSQLPSLKRLDKKQSQQS